MPELRNPGGRAYQVPLVGSCRRSSQGISKLHRALLESLEQVDQAAGIEARQIGEQFAVHLPGQRFKPLKVESFELASRSLMGVGRTLSPRWPKAAIPWIEEESKLTVSEALGEIDFEAIADHWLARSGGYRRRERTPS
jgi:hypothetical protein